jgi:hypothetical protein
MCCKHTLSYSIDNTSICRVVLTNEKHILGNENKWTNVRFRVLVGMSTKMAAFRYVVCVVWYWPTFQRNLLPPASGGSEQQYSVELLFSLKSSWITIVKSDAETGLTSRYFAIIMIVVYSTRRLLTNSVSLIKDNWMINLFILLCFTLD